MLDKIAVAVEALIAEGQLVEAEVLLSTYGEVLTTEYDFDSTPDHVHAEYLYEIGSSLFMVRTFAGGVTLAIKVPAND
jgi:hypothetical protein